MSAHISCVRSASRVPFPNQILRHAQDERNSCSGHCDEGGSPCAIIRCMITKFGVLYAGCVDMDDIGYAGTPANERWLSDDQLRTVFDKSEAFAVTMDRLGYDTLWGAEHHFQREGYECIPNLLMLFVHLAHVTEKLKFGCGFNINPMWHPLRLAEDYATADILTNGRVRFGIGRGYHSREVEVFGNPIIDQDANRELFEEQVEVMFKAFNERAFSHHGKHYDIPPRVPYRGYELEEITLVPRPVNPVEWWQPVVSASERGLNFMAKYGIKGVIGGGAAPGGAADQVVQRWQEVQAQHGRELELGGDLVISFSVYIADSEQQALDESRLWAEERVKMFGPLGFVRGLSDEQVDAINSNDRDRLMSADLPTIEGDLESGGFFAGPAEMVTEKLMEVQERYPGLEEVNLGITGMGMPESATLEQMHRFAEGVMPHFSTS